MSKNAMFDLTYGLFVVSVHADGRDNACITNTVQQVTGVPNRISLTLNKSNYTHDLLMKNGYFTASIISEAAEFELFRRFGFQSGRDADKFAGFDAVRRTQSGTLAVTQGTNSAITARIFHSVDLGTHTIFFADVVEEAVFSDVPSATYAYSHANIKPKPEAVGTTPDGQTVWRCRICGYEYVGEELPDDFVCPLCKHPASDFEKVVK